MTKTQYKAALLIYDDIEQQDGAKCYCLSDRTVAMLLSLTGTLYWKTRWEGYKFFEADQLNNIFEWSSTVERELMNGCCGDAGQTIRLRVNTDVRVEVSVDGGETWTADDDYDPRSTGTVYAPITGGTTNENACMAAANVVANMTELINEDFVGILTSVIGLAGISAALAPIVAVWMGVPVAGQGVATAVFIAGLVGAGAAEGAAALTDAFDTEFYDWFACEYYCRVGNRSANWDDVDGLIEAINEEYPDGGDDLTLRVIGFGVLKALGPVGLTNMARLGASTVDCSECDCPNPFCYTWTIPPTGSVDDWTLVIGDVVGGFWQGVASGPADRLFARLSFDFGASEVTLIEADFSNVAGILSRILVDDVIVLDIGPVSSGWHGVSGSWTGSHVIDVYLDGVNGTGSQMVMGAFRLSGDGDNPFGEDNCDE